ncbi:MAG TPA: glycosyltransferase family 39 protein [Bryobacteraceae bacterium]|nr:glycosyltransferase family 39 protein [Bryobacteraceae bacterium]
MTTSRARLAFFALSLFFLGTTLVWLRLDRSPPAWDDAFYLTNSVVMYDALTSGGLRGFARQFLTIMGIKPPLIALLPAPVYLVAGRNTGAAFAVNLAAMLVIFGVLYRLGRKYGGRRAGLAAVWIAGTMPILYGLSRWYLVECGLTAIVCAAIWLIVEWMEAPDRWKAFLIGVVCGLGLLMKFSFPLYVGAPLLYAALRKGVTPKTLLAFAAPAILLAAPWYAFNFGPAWRLAVLAGTAENTRVYQTGDIFSIGDIWRYLGNVCNAGLTIYFAALAVLLAVFGRTARPSGRRGLMVCALWSVPLVFLTFGHYRDLRYAAPLYPSLALALGILADAAFENRRAALPLFLTAGLAGLSLFHTSFGVLGSTSFDLGGLLFVRSKLSYARMYDPAPWPHRELLDRIYRSSRFNGAERKTLLVGTDSAVFNVNNLELAAREAELPFQFAATTYESGLNTLLPLVHSAAYFLYEEGGGPPGPFNPRAADAIREVRESGRFTELPIGLAWPDGGTAHVYANLGPGGFTSTGVMLGAGLERIADCDVTFDGKLQLTGLSMEQRAESIEVKYRWRCLKLVTRDYWCFTHIVDRQGAVAGYLDHPILNGSPPTSLWKAGDVVIESLRFQLPADRRSQSYRLRIGLFHRESGQRLPITGSSFPLTDSGTAAFVSP